MLDKREATVRSTFEINYEYAQICQGGFDLSL